MNSKDYFAINSVTFREHVRALEWREHLKLATIVYLDGKTVLDKDKEPESSFPESGPIHEKMWIEESKTQYLTAVPERILCAAIWWDDGIVRSHMPKNIDSGIVACGWRHHNCFAIASWGFPNRDYLQLEDIQGFLTNHDRFVDRKEAFIIAQRAGQIDPVELTKFPHREELYSEHLY